MTNWEKVVLKLQILRTWCAVNPNYGKGLCVEDCRSAVKWLDNAIALLKAQDEELERLKLCRHNCKIDCLLESYNRVVEERDALRKAREPRLITAADFADNPDVDDRGYIPCWVECNEIEIASGIKNGIIVPGETVDGWTEVSLRDMPGGDFYNPNVRYWTRKPSQEQREETPWQIPENS